MDEKQNFTEGSIPKKLIAFMGPVFAAQVLQAMYGAVDLLVVGKFGTTADIAAVSTGSGIMHLLTFAAVALTTAVTILIGRYIGEKRTEKLSKLIGSTISFFLLLSIVMSILIVVFAKPLAVVMQTPDEALELTVSYIQICGAGFLFIVFYNYISAIFRGMGDSNTPLLFVGIACIVNIIGDLVLVAVFHMNTAGAAIATVAAQAVSVILSLIIIKNRNLPFTLKKDDFKMSSEIPNVIRIGTPLAFQQILTNLTFLALHAFINRLGLDPSSGYGVAEKVQQFIMLIPSSIMQSMASFVAQNVGAQKEDRAVKGMLWGMGFGAMAGILVTIAVFLRGDLVSELFTNDMTVVKYSWDYLKGFVPDAILTSISFSFMGYFNGHEKSLFVMAQGLAQSLVVRLPMSYIMSIQPEPSLVNIGLAAPCATVFGIILCLIYYFKIKKESAK